MTKEKKFIVSPDDLWEFTSYRRAYKSVLCLLVYAYISYWQKENLKKGKPFYLLNEGTLADHFDTDIHTIREVMKTLTRTYQLGQWLSAEECSWVKTMTKRNKGHKRVWVTYDHLYGELDYDDNTGELKGFQPDS